MCAPASFVLTKNKVFWSKTSDSHEDIIAEHKLHADGARGANVVRVEITPPDNDFRLPIDQWIYKVDQDETPKWYDAKEHEEFVRIALPEWIGEKIILPNETRDINEGDYILASYGNVIDMWGGTLNDMRGGTLNYMRGGTLNYMWGGTLNDMWGGTLNYMRGGTLQVYKETDTAFLKNPNAVMIDRSRTDNPRIFVGGKEYKPE